VGFGGGEVSYGFSFSAGANGSVSISNSEGFISSSWSLEVWVKPGSNTEAWLVGQAYGRQLKLYPGTSGPKVALAVNTSPYNWQVLMGPEISLGEWSHVVGVCDSAHGTLTLYVNGVPGQPVALGLAPWDSGCAWTLSGVNNVCGYSGQYLSGGLDEVTIYNSALLADVIQAIYYAWEAGKCTPEVNATRDLLLIYNSTSPDSQFVKDYYLAHRPMVGGASVLGIACPTTYTIKPDDFTNTVLLQLSNWFNANPTLRPQYIVLFLDVPSRINDNTNWGPPWEYPYSTNSSVSYRIHSMLPGYQPLVTHINMRDFDTYQPGTNACEAYINKLEYFGKNYSPGRLIISASAGGYSNTNYIVDNVRRGTCCDPVHDYSVSSPVPVAVATNGLYAAGVPASAVLYADGVEACAPCSPTALTHIRNAVNVAGYVCWGSHSSLLNEYAIAANGVAWQGNSGWWIIETVESYNGQPRAGNGDFYMWFDHRGFGGGIYTNYENTPVGAVTHVDEPGLGGVNNTYSYFDMWASGSNFAICAWASRNTDKFQAVGDPFVTR
jgi:hypothetical protein